MYEDEHKGSGAQSGAVITDAPEDRMIVPGDKGRAATAAELENDKLVRLSDNLMSHYLHELNVQAPNRAEMAEDEAYYDGEQWDALDKAVLAERGQEALTYNVTKTTLNWIIGTERRGRTDFRILPRREEGTQGAEKKTQLLKYLSDVNRSEFEASAAFAEMVKAGISFMESGVQDTTEGEPIYDAHASWRDIVWDSTARKLHLEDGRYQFRHRWMDVDTATAFFPKKADTIRAASFASHDYAGYTDSYGDEPMDAQEQYTQEIRNDHMEHPRAVRQRVRMIEGWFKVPKTVGKMQGGDFAGEIFDPTSIGHQMEIAMGRAKAKPVTAMVMHVMIFTQAGPVWFSPSPYRHNKFPFTPMICYRNAETLQPYGVIRDLKSMQKDINKRLAKALAILSSNKTIMDEGAVADIDEFADEVSRPDAIIVKRPGMQLDISADRDLAAPHLEIMSNSIGMIQQVSGVTDENLGRETNAGSGKAIIARQEQGALATALIFDNVRFARQVHGEKMLSLTEQFMTEEKQFRITDLRGSAVFVNINDGLPENDIIRTKADFIISEQDYNDTIRQAQFQEAVELIAKIAPSAPEIVLATLDLLFDMTDMPNREEIVKRIRAITGAADPDADPNNPTPEEMERQQAAQEQQAQQKRIQDAQIAKTEGEAAEKQARAEKTVAEIEKLRSAKPGETLDIQKKALDLAVETIQNRSAANIADDLMAEAGLNITPPPLERIPLPHEIAASQQTPGAGVMPA